MKYLIVFVAWILVIAGMLVDGAGQQTPPAGGGEILSRPITNDIDRGGSPPDVATEVLRDLGISGGVVLTQGCADTPAATKFKARPGTTVREALDDFEAANPGYHWEDRGGLLNLVPRTGIPPFLGSRIQSFELQTTDQQTTVGLVFARLLALPEIRQSAADLHLKPGLETGHPGVYTENPTRKEPVPIRIQLKDVSLQDGFNAVVQAFGHTMWVYEQRECGGEKTYIVNETQY
ncbi:MAG: hypothetical protein WA188_09275 [Terriglobales bacterium]